MHPAAVVGSKQQRGPLAGTASRDQQGAVTLVRMRFPGALCTCGTAYARFESRPCSAAACAACAACAAVCRMARLGRGAHARTTERAESWRWACSSLCNTAGRRPHRPLLPVHRLSLSLSCVCPRVASRHETFWSDSALTRSRAPWASKSSSIAACIHSRNCATPTGSYGSRDRPRLPAMLRATKRLLEQQSLLTASGSLQQWRFLNIHEYQVGGVNRLGL